MKVILATQSRSRRELVEKYNLDWELRNNSFDEEEYKRKNKVLINEEGIKTLTKNLALGKANSIKHLQENAIIIGCDTVVLCDDKLLEKPTSIEEAEEMLSFLQNKVQKVVTGVAMVNTKTNKQVLFNSITELVFHNFTEEQIKFLIEKTNPLENAGAYEYCDEIKENVLIKSGSADNVIGIPIKEIMLELSKM